MTATEVAVRTCSSCGIDTRWQRCSPCNKDYMRAYNARIKADKTEEELQADRVLKFFQHVKRKYDLNQDEYLWLQLGNPNCQVCDRELDYQVSAGKGKRDDRACVDHCKDTGRIRGMLCGNCNKAIGKLGDTLESIQRVVRYLESV